MSGYETGLLGEALAAEHLKSLGLKVVATRWRGTHGEVDVIARDGRCLCFIEVKHRPQGRLGSGLAAITPDKLDRLRQTAREYLRGHPAPYRVGCLEITRAGVLYYPDVLHEA
ncbi:MAG TPA: YraN family protein [Candidatus Limnocylindria bacterium]|nr:YraN family protein [Candidatus Limnocylindria bacterium]